MPCLDYLYDLSNNSCKFRIKKIKINCRENAADFRLLQLRLYFYIYNFILVLLLQRHRQTLLFIFSRFLSSFKTFSENFSPVLNFQLETSFFPVNKSLSYTLTGSLKVLRKHTGIRHFSVSLSIFFFSVISLPPRFLGTQTQFLAMLVSCACLFLVEFMFVLE